MTLEQWAWVYYGSWLLWLIPAWWTIKGYSVSFVVLALAFLTNAVVTVWYAIATGQYAFIALLATIIVFSVAFTKEEENADS